MARVTVHHLTRPRHLPLIEESGLRTRADLSGALGPLEALDRTAPGTFANGRRVSAWLDEDHARAQVDALGAGHVEFTVDPAKVLAAPAGTRGEDPVAYWAGARPLAAWLADGDPPLDLEVHQNVPVRAKHVVLRAPLLVDDDLDTWAPVVASVADADRLAAKALMHLALIASAGDFDGVDFLAACALAWRDEADPPGLVRELIETDPDKIVSAVLAEQQAGAPGLVERLRDVLEETRSWADEQGLEPGQALFERSTEVLDMLERPR
jgi:hypothetical protein